MDNPVPVPQISLICATLNRFIELEALLHSLEKQTFKEFELIIVDQNDNIDIVPLIRRYDKIMKIIHIKSSKKGLSYNRNIGLTYAGGNIIGFPDDDCEYKPDTLETIYNFFGKKGSYDFFAFNLEDKFTGKNYFTKNKFDFSFGKFHSSGNSNSIFCNKTAIARFKFDERFGLGAKYHAGEEGDLLLYLLANKSRGFYDGVYSIYHPKPTKGYNPERNYNYGVGFGALLKKAIVVYKKKYLFILYCRFIIRNIAALIISPHKKYYYYGLKGKIKGYLSYSKS